MMKMILMIKVGMILTTKAVMILTTTTTTRAATRTTQIKQQISLIDRFITGLLNIYMI
jgi:hypothetical protein